MSQPSEDKDIASFTKFLGLRNTTSEESFELGDLTVAQNVDQTDSYRLRRRRGFVATPTTGAYHSVGGNGLTALAVTGSSLMRVLPDFTTRLVRTGLTSGLRMKYAAMGDRIFYTNNAETGVFVNGFSRSWGIVPPDQPSKVEIVGGNVPAGFYQYGMTFVRTDGQESGAGTIGSMELTATGGFHFYDMPISQDSDVQYKRLYISPRNGDAMFLQFTLSPDATEAFYDVERSGVLPLATMFLIQALPSRHLAAFAGHILLARGNVLYRSEPYSPELFDLRKGIPFPSGITLIGPMDDGVYLGTETEVYWLGGRDPSAWEAVRRAVHGVIPGTEAYHEADDVQENAQGPVILFATTIGIRAGFNGGTLINLTEDRFNYPIQEEGAAIVRHIGGSAQYVVTMRGTETPGNTAF